MPRKTTLSERIVALEIKMDQALKSLETYGQVLEKIHNFLFEKNGGENSMLFIVKQNQARIKDIEERQRKKLDFRSNRRLVLTSGALGFLTALFIFLLDKLIMKVFF